MGLRLKEGIACRRYAIMVANMRRNITRIFGKKLINHHIIAILKRWHHRENNRWGFVNTIIAYLRHASGGGVATPGWQHLRRYQPGANHNRVPPARCSFHSPHCTASAFDTVATNKSLHCNARCSDLFVDILLSSSFIPL